MKNAKLAYDARAFGPVVAGLAVLLALVLSASAASAAVVRDNDAFSIDVGAARICFVIPRDLRTDEECEGLTPESVTLTDDFVAKTVAFGLVRMERDGEAPDLAMLIVTRISTFGVSEPEAKDARDYGRGVAVAMKKDLPAGARLRSADDVRVVRPGSHTLVRGVFDVDGLPADADKAILAHQVHHTVFTKDGGYAVVWSGKRGVARRLETFADAAAPTLAVSRPAAQRDESLAYKTGYALGTILGPLVIGVVGCVIAFAVSRSRRRTAYPMGPYAPYPPPYGYGSPPYGASYPPTAPPVSGAYAPPAPVPANPWAVPPQQGFDAPQTPPSARRWWDAPR